MNDLCMDASKDYSLQIDFSHVAGVGNIADYNSKTSFDSDPFLLVNSNDWRHGNVAFTAEQFPPEEMIFMKYYHGSLVKYKQPKMDQNTPVNLTCCAGVTNDVFMISRLGHFSVRN